jgi:hypothetical protein
MKTLLTLTFLFLLSFVGVAQQFRGGMSPQEREKLESAKIAYITNRLNLTSDQAKDFWPIYNEYERKRYETRTRPMREGYRMTNGGKNSPTEEQAAALIVMHMESRNQDLVQEREYIGRLQTVLDNNQILRLLTIDESFLRNYLMRQVRGEGNEEPPATVPGRRGTGN